jgi:hypothetical protein
MRARAHAELSLDTLNPFGLLAAMPAPHQDLLRLLPMFVSPPHRASLLLPQIMRDGRDLVMSVSFILFVHILDGVGSAPIRLLHLRTLRDTGAEHTRRSVRRTRAGGVSHLLLLFQCELLLGSERAIWMMLMGGVFQFPVIFLDLLFVLLLGEFFLILR